MASTKNDFIDFLGLFIQPPDWPSLPCLVLREASVLCPHIPTQRSGEEVPLSSPGLPSPPSS